MQQKVDIELFETEELISELLSRHDVGCFFGMKILTSGNDVVYNRVKGPPVAVLGLVELEKNRLSNFMM